MKTFKHLKFKQHPNGFDGVQAVMFFNNGYGISVVRFASRSGGYGSYTDNEQEWEVAVLVGNKNESSLTYNTPITDDVIGHLTEPEVTKVMRQIQELPSVQP